MPSSRGFSLAEIMMAMLLVTVGLLAVGHTLMKALEANYRTSLEAEALAYAQQKIEELKTLPFTHGDLTNGSHSDTPAEGFARTWTVSESGDEKTIMLTSTKSIPNQTLPVQVVLALQRVQ